MNTKVIKVVGLVFVLVALATAAGVFASTDPGSATSSESNRAQVIHNGEELSGPTYYIIQLSSPPLASYRGGIEGLAATNPEARGEHKLDSKSEASLDYLAYLAQEQDQFVAATGQLLGRVVEVKYHYQHAFNGVAMWMSPAEAEQVAGLLGVRLVIREAEEVPLTDVGPTWIGADGIWDGSSTGGLPGTMGEGVIVGIIDTGINHDNPSFADIGGDGYDHTNPFGSGVYVGHCVGTPSFCNDKLIGAWNYTDGPHDTDGHGSHTASTVAGNVVLSTTINAATISFTADISGVAPHANIIAYDACQVSCPGAGLLAAVNQAVADGVDVINYSISGGTNPYNDSVELAFLAARDAGVFVAASAGNAGTVGSVNHRSPWLTTVGASTHNRAFLSSLINMTGGSTTPPPDLDGRSISAGYGPATIVYAGAPPYNNSLCAPFPPGTFSGQIVVCDRGTYGRVEKGQNVLNAGGGGYVLANDSVSGPGLNADPHVLPAVHLTYDDGVVLKAWIASGTGHMATITATTMDIDAQHADVMASFSSRGPNGALPDVIKPDITAPGVDVWAAYKDPELHWIISGTSMSSPHTAGAGALMKALHPDWSPAEIQSALMSTAQNSGVTKPDGTTPADAFDMGAGRVDLSQAGTTGFVLHETLANYQAANPATGGDPRTLNTPSLGDNDCANTCSWTRTISSTMSSAVTWNSSYSAPAGMSISVSPSSFTLGAYASRQITITADVNGIPNGQWTFANVSFTPTSSPPAPAHFPVAVIANNVGDAEIDVDPDTLESTQPPDTTVTEVLTISNLGSSNLDWTIYEGDGAESQVVDWSDNFDSYAPGSQMHGQGGWKGWFNDPAAGALVSNAQSNSAPNSVEIVGASDLVREFSGYNTGVWSVTAWQYVPTTFSGTTYFILLNSYDDSGAGLNWSVQVNFNSGTNLVANDGVSGGTLPLVRGQWVEIRVEIDLINDTQDFYYNNQLLYSGTWTDEVSGGGSLNIDTIDLYANGATAVYYDDTSLTEVVPDACDAPSDVPWLSASPTSGTTAGGASSDVDVTFDSTGLSLGVYTAELCVESNDPATPHVTVPISLTVAGTPAITLDKTVGTDAGACATTDTITATVGTAVTYCYTVTNTGDVTLETHDLDDSELGAILTDLAYSLTPADSTFVTVTAVINQDTTNTATWTAETSTGAPAMATDTATVNVTYALYLPVIIYDDGSQAATPPASAPPAAAIGLGLPLAMIGLGLGVRRRKQAG